MLILNDIDSVRSKSNNPVYFVHIPKNGGAAINQQIIRHRPQRVVSCGHAHPVVIGPKFGYDQIDHVRFAVFRDPFDHLVSLAEYSKSQIRLAPKLLARFNWMTQSSYVVDKIGLMRRFLEQIQREKERPSWIDICTARQQISMLKMVNVDRKILDQNHKDITDWSERGNRWSEHGNRGMYMWKVLDDLGLGFNTKGDWCVDVVLRFDRLQDELTSFCGLVGIPNIVINKYNASRRGKTDMYYDEHNIKLVEGMFTEDIAFWKRMNDNV